MSQIILSVIVSKSYKAYFHIYQTVFDRYSHSNSNSNSNSDNNNYYY